MNPMKAYHSLNRFFISLFGLFSVFVSCSSLILEEMNADDSECFSWAESEGVKNVLRRATQLANITWTPLLDVPGNAGVYPAFSEVLGIPYSSTKQINKYVGQDVSFHTFMTAVHNPRSVLYTENLREAPYYGTNCACYYGTVCSSAVAYALDLAAPYSSSYYPTLPGFYEVPNQELEYLKPGDILQRKGHVFMIYRLHKNRQGVITGVSYFEAASRYARISTIPADSFKSRVENEHFIAYRYETIDEVRRYEATPYVAVGNESVQTVVYNDSLCPNRGDESVYRTDESVTINVFDESYPLLVLEGPERFEFSSSGDDVVLYNLSPGKYDAYLADGVKKSDAVSFIVAEPIVNVYNEGLLHISFACEQGQPLYCVLCDKYGSGKSIHEFSEEEITRGSVDVEPLDNDAYYCKVVFRTPFGTVINNPITITR